MRGLPPVAFNRRSQPRKFGSYFALLGSVEDGTVNLNHCQVLAIWPVTVLVLLLTCLSGAGISRVVSWNGPIAWLGVFIPMYQMSAWWPGRWRKP